MKRDPTQDRAKVRAYLASLPPRTRRRLRSVRTAVRAAAPGGVEGFSYRIPALWWGGRVLIYYAGWKSHVALYPITAAVRRDCAAATKGFELSKGTIRFPLDQPLPAALVRRIVKARMAELRAEGKLSSR